jgi:membrane-associated phospholipid phosphatase
MIFLFALVPFYVLIPEFLPPRARHVPELALDRALPLACSRVHRRLGIIAMISATLVAFSTLLTKQHYVLDLVAGVFLAFVAYDIFLRRYSSEQVSEFDRQVAPTLALCVSAVVAVSLATSWLAYIWGAEFTFGP